MCPVVGLEPTPWPGPVLRAEACSNLLSYTEQLPSIFQSTEDYARHLLRYHKSADSIEGYQLLSRLVGATLLLAILPSDSTSDCVVELLALSVAATHIVLCTLKVVIDRSEGS